LVPPFCEDWSPAFPPKADIMRFSPPKRDFISSRVILPFWSISKRLKAACSFSLVRSSVSLRFAARNSE